MKALAHRLRGRRTSKRDDGLVNDNGFRFEEAVKYGETRRPIQERAVGDHKVTSHKLREDNWRKNRDINCKADSSSALVSNYGHDADVFPHSVVKSPSLEQPRSESSQLQKPITRAQFVSRRDEIAALSPQSAPIDELVICRSISSSDSHSPSVGRRTRFRYGETSRSLASLPSANNLKVDGAVDVGHRGYLMIKSGPDHVDKRYYFIARCHTELYACENETSFMNWLQSGHTLEDRSEEAFTGASGLDPVLMGTVLRANGLLEEGEEKNLFSVILGSASKCITLQFAAEDEENATLWLDALHEVQITKEHGSEHPSKLGSAFDKRLLLSLTEHSALRGTDLFTSSAELTGDNEDMAEENAARVAVPAFEEICKDRESMVLKNASSSDVRKSSVYSGKLQSNLCSEEATVVSTPTSYTGASPTSTSVTSEDIDRLVAFRRRAGSNSSSQSLYASRVHRMDSVTSNSSTISGQSQCSTTGNVLLFVPVVGSSLTASASKLARAKLELNALATNGAGLPSRVMQSTVNGETIEWRYGLPEYVLTDLAYAKGRIRELDTNSLASYVEEGCQTFILEATHKSRYDQWHSVDQASFYLQVNDGMQVPGSSILENDMFGLLYLGDAVKYAGASYGSFDDNPDLRVVLAEAFPDGFPMEVLDVFTPPRQCYFSWRHWGPFTGKYKGIKGDGSKVEVRGFGEMTFGASRMQSLRLFYNQNDLISGLQQIIDRVVRKRRDTATIFDLNVGYRRKMRATSASIASVQRKETAPNPKTSDIVEELANFTIEAKKQRRKQTQ